MNRIAAALFAGLLCAAASAQYAEGFVTSGYDPDALTEADLAQTNNVAAPLERVSVDGWKRTGVVERYTPESMYGKINGRSELYLSYDCVALGFAHLEQDGDPDAFVDIFLYDMVTPLQAFGVYGIEQWEEVEEVELGDVGYQTGADVFFRKGPFYAALVPSEDTPALREAAMAVARALAGELEGKESGIWGRRYFEDAEDSLRYFHVDAMSLEFMTNTFTADVDIDREPVTHFISMRESAAQAAKTVEAFREYFERYGEDLGQQDENGVTMYYADMGGGYYDAVFQSGKLIAGVTTSEGKETTLKAAAGMLQRVLP